jgi:bifunctional non-homologous end joining protein LigD
VIPIIPTVRKDPFDDPTWSFELKYDGFRGIADTVRGRMLSKNRNHLKRYDSLLEGLSGGCVFDGEIVALDDVGGGCTNSAMTQSRLNGITR